MLELLGEYWPHLVAALSITVAVVAAAHAAMTKDEVRSAIGWVGVILLSPLLGASIYAIVGVNRVRRRSIAAERIAAGHADTDHARFDVQDELLAERFGRRLLALKSVGDHVTHHRMTAANHIAMLRGGDETYAAMLQAIAAARRSILLESYIFAHDHIGRRLADALIAAKARGVVVRVLLDAVGMRYSLPTSASYLRSQGIDVAGFNGNVVARLRLPYANLRTHRKILVVDGATAFAGGMNIRQSFTTEFAGTTPELDTHFQLRGPVVADLFAVAAEDWHFTTGEQLQGAAWRMAEVAAATTAPVFIQPIPSGPDDALEANHKMLMGAFSIARRSIRIMSPYFLPDRELISALTTAARRGVDVDVVVPGQNNIAIVDRAMTAQFNQVVRSGCRVWRAHGPFNHSKLLTVDSVWAFVGSSNLDPRSLRLNFEIDLGVLDAAFATEIEARISAAIAHADAVTPATLQARPLPARLLDRTLWLASPYL